MNDFLEQALACADRNWYVFPLRPGSKEPATPHGFKDATIQRGEIQAWWASIPEANLGLACGQSGLTVIDIDTYRGGMREWERLKFEAPTRISRTGGGGVHLIYQTPLNVAVKSGNNKLGE